MSKLKFGDKEYALVPDRLKKFREDNPRGSVSTTFTFGEDGSLTFKAYILKDKADETSADATGTAFYTAKDMQKVKAFEKLETISVGRALSLLGYLNDGQIASSEEMEEFEEYKNQQKFEGIELAITQIEAAEDMEKLKQVFTSLGGLVRESSVIEAKDKRKAELSESTANTTA